MDQIHTIKTKQGIHFYSTNNIYYGLFKSHRPFRVGTLKFNSKTKEYYFKFNELFTILTISSELIYKINKEIERLNK